MQKVMSQRFASLCTRCTRSNAFSGKELLRPYLIKSNNFKSLSTVKEGGEREKMCDNGLRSAVADMSAAG